VNFGGPFQDKLRIRYVIYDSRDYEKLPMIIIFSLSDSDLTFVLSWSAILFRLATELN